MPRSSTWPEYLALFHAQRPGITEAVLNRCRDGDDSPYDWLRSAVPAEGRVSEVACGSAPLWPALQAQPWVGTDLSLAELGQARRRGAAPLVRADATAQPFRGGCAAAVVCSMAMMLVQPLNEALSEARRMLSKGGLLVLLLPATGPLAMSDRVRYARLFLALRRPGLVYPNDHELGDPAFSLVRADLTLLSDERRRFRLYVTDRNVARTFVESLYLPDEPAGRLQNGYRVAERWIGEELAVPLRRIVAQAR